MSNVTNISNAVAYVDVVMRTSDMGQHSHYEMIERGARSYSLSLQEVIGIIRESVRNDDIPNKRTILKEINSDEFERYIARKLEPYNKTLMSA